MLTPSASGVDYGFHRVTKAQKNIYFYNLGSERNYYDPLGIDAERCERDGGVPKSN
jgi:hypothetical protein